MYDYKKEERPDQENSIHFPLGRQKTYIQNVYGPRHVCETYFDF